MHKLIASLFSLGAIAFSAAPVMAIEYNSNTVYKIDRDGVTNIIISSTPNSGVAVQLNGVRRTSARIAGACGEVRISSSTGQYTGLEVNDTGVDYATLPVNTLPRCVGGTFEEARSGNFRLPTGQVIIVGQTPGSAVKVMLPTDRNRNLRVNACGFATLRPTSSTPLPETFRVGTTQYTVASLPEAPGGRPLCRRSGTNHTGYVPSAWMAPMP